MSATTANAEWFSPGSIVAARGREWVVLPGASDPDLLRLRPLGGAEEDSTLIYLPLERDAPCPASFPPPDPDKTGAQTAALLLRDALLLKLRAGAGPFRSFGNIAVEPRAYQLVPLLMALKMDVIRLSRTTLELERPSRAALSHASCWIAARSAESRSSAHRISVTNGKKS